MKIEKITDNKIRIILKENDYNDKILNINTSFFSLPESQTLLLKILDKAKKEINFDTDGYKLLIEAFYQENNIVFTITKYLENKSIRKYSSKKYIKNPETFTRIYKFSDFENFCTFCNFIHNKKQIQSLINSSYIYFYKHIYYLVINNKKENINLFKKYNSLLLEFFDTVNYSKNFELKLKEYGKSIIKNNAISMGIKYFN